MCIICVSPARTRQPSVSQIKTMFARNPHGAGYMYARGGRVHIHKGFMDVESFLKAIRAEHFTAKDSVVYHFRISTQAGVNPEMTHPFPLSNQLAHMKALDAECECGVAHNGIIRLTSDPTNHEYSDTALSITRYLSEIIHSPNDLTRPRLLNYIAGTVEAGHYGQNGTHRDGRHVHQRARTAVQQHQLPGFQIQIRLR